MIYSTTVQKYSHPKLAWAGCPQPVKVLLAILFKTFFSSNKIRISIRSGIFRKVSTYLCLVIEGKREEEEAKLAT